MKRERNQKERLLEETTGQCVYCGRPLNLGEMEIDHIVPLSIGGENNYANKVCSCPRCNAEKANKSLQEFLEAMPDGKLFHYWNRVDALLDQGKLPPEKWMLLTKIDPTPVESRPLLLPIPFFIVGMTEWQYRP